MCDMTYLRVTHSCVTHSCVTHSCVTHSCVTHSCVTHSCVTHSFPCGTHHIRVVSCKCGATSTHPAAAFVTVKQDTVLHTCNTQRDSVTHKEALSHTKRPSLIQRGSLTHKEALSHTKRLSHIRRGSLSHKATLSHTKRLSHRKIFFVFAAVVRV